MRPARPLNRYIDHTLLKPFATQDQFEALLDEAIKFQFESVCVSPYMAVPILDVLRTVDPRVKVCTVVDFPLGNKPLELKVQEVEYFASRGIHEVDFVLNYGELKNRNFKAVLQEIITLSDTCARHGTISKCIVETCYLDHDEKVTIFNLIKEFAPNLQFIKTSTGFGSDGARLEDIKLWSDLRGGEQSPLIKAAGGIKTLDDALSLIDAGADRLGMSASVKVMEEYNARFPETFTEGESQA